MFVNTSPPPLPVVQSTPEPRVAAPQPVKAPTFASLLRQNQPAPASPPAAPAATANEDSPSSAPADESAQPAAAMPRARTAAADKSSRPAEKPAAKVKAKSDDDDAAPAESANRSDDTTPTGGNPLLAHWMSHLHRPVELPTSTLSKAAAATGDSTSATSGDSVQDGSGATLSAAQTLAATDRGDAGAAQLAMTADAFAARSDAIAVGASAAIETRTEASALDAKATLPASLDPTPAALPTPAGFAASLAAASDRQAAPAAVSIATPVNAPDFPQALGVQLSVLARDGIQHAELHLNPADMGPVSVQIEMNGNQARIDFGADMAATRHAIEAGLPELASALRDAGFTLSGGGVSQHSRGGSEPGGDRDGESRRHGRSVGGAGNAIDGSAMALGAARRQVALGGLDLYA